MSKKHIQHLREEVQAKLGSYYDEAVFQKALKKAQCWMRNAYGCLDYSEFGVDGLMFYYEETLMRPEGVDTFNRVGDLNRRHLSRGKRKR